MCIQELTAIDVIDDLENSLSASLNFRLRLSALLLVFLLLAKYRSHPLMMLPYSCLLYTSHEVLHLSATEIFCPT